MLEGEELTKLETRRLRKDSSFVDVGIWTAPLCDVNDDISGWMAIIADFTERKRVEEALMNTAERFQVLVEQAADAFFVIESRGRFVDVNKETCDSLGYTREELLTLSVPDIAFGFERSFEEEFKRMVPGVSLTLPGSLRRKDGSSFPVEVRSVLIELDGHLHSFALGRDLTERKRAEEAQRELAILEERHRLAWELHDSVTQSLYSLSLIAEAGHISVSSGRTEGLQDDLARITEISQQAQKEMRLLIHELRPPILETEGLIGALHQRLDSVERRAGIEPRLLFEEPVELPLHLEENLYHIAQEALNNALRHASATSVTVKIDTKGNNLELEIEDNGRGFNPDTIVGKGGMGLTSMRERAEKVRGSLTIITVPGEGTKVKVRVSAKAIEIESLEPPRYPDD